MTRKLSATERAARLLREAYEVISQEERLEGNERRRAELALARSDIFTARMTLRDVSPEPAT